MGVNTLNSTITPITIITIPATLFTLTMTRNLIFFFRPAYKIAEE